MINALQVLLRGAVLRNTPWCYGLVLFAGKDTKLMQNSGKTKFKRTSIDKLLNFIILGIVIFLLSMCLFCTVACGFWESMIGFNFKVNYHHTLEWSSLFSFRSFCLGTQWCPKKKWQGQQSSLSLYSSPMSLSSTLSFPSLSMFLLRFDFNLNV